jgi:hypothetical protein
MGNGRGFRPSWAVRSSCGCTTRAGYTVPELTYELMIAGEDTVAHMGLWAGVGAELGVM